MTIAQRLQNLAITLPAAAKPAANYVPFVKDQGLVYISGQLPFIGGQKDGIGKVGKEVSKEEAQAYARLCGVNILAQLQEACDGDLERVEQCIKLGVFVHSVDSFTEQPFVANGVSDLMVDVLAEKGKHARFAVSANQLPFGVAVEVDALFRIK